MEHWLYLFLNAFTISIPAWRSFDKRLNFHREWPKFFLGAFLVGLVFILWDIYFTANGIWGFNPRYLSGIEWFGLPLGEYLFFICIPFACIFSYRALGYFLGEKFHVRNHLWISRVLALALLTVGFMSWGKWYTSTTFIALGLYLAAHGWWWKKRYMGQFYLTYLFILIPFFLVNGVLTGSWIDQEVVWYNDNHNLGFRLGTIPVEDIFYGMLLILANVDWLENAKTKFS